jgi:hypothetical protein
LLPCLTDQGEWGAGELTELALSCADLVQKR